METVHNDRLLFERISEGDEHAFKQLFEAYVPRLKAYFFKLTRDQQQVQELVQETFLNVWVYRKNLTSIETPSAYLYKIAANLTATWFRKMDLERQLVKAAPAFTDEEPIEPLVSIKELRQQIDTAVLSLPQQQKTIFLLSRQEGLTRREIARRLNLSENTVRNHLTLALNSIQEHLKNYHSLFIPLFFLDMLFS
jgi:RNA polymerase sigma-70 factor (family 1)